MNTFTFSVTVEVSRVEGKFAARDELAAVMVDWLESADGGEIATDNGATYSIDDWSVDDISQPRRKPVTTPRRQTGGMIPSHAFKKQIGGDGCAYCTAPEAGSVHRTVR